MYREVSQPRTCAFNQQEHRRSTEDHLLRAVPPSVAQLPHVEARVTGLQKGHGHVDLPAVQASGEPEAAHVFRVEPRAAAALGHGQQGGLAAGAAVVQVEAGGSAALQLRGAGELQGLAVRLLTKDQLRTGCS